MGIHLNAGTNLGTPAGSNHYWRDSKNSSLVEGTPFRCGAPPLSWCSRREGEIGPPDAIQIDAGGHLRQRSD
jgi:hypothetical protein